MTLKGSINKNCIPALKEWAQETAKTIKELYQETGQKVKTTVDLSSLVEKYDSEGIMILSSLMKENEPYIERTATFGANWTIKFAEDIVINLAGRKNIKTFENKKDALEWLME